MLVHHQVQTMTFQCLFSILGQTNRKFVGMFVQPLTVRIAHNKQKTNFIHNFRFLFCFLYFVFHRVAYLRPFVNEIGAVSNFVLKSQWKYQVPFELAKKQVNNGSFSLDFFFFSCLNVTSMELIYMNFCFICKSSSTLCIH